MHRDGSTFSVHLVVSEVRDERGKRQFIGKCVLADGGLALSRRGEIMMTSRGDIESVNDGLVRIFGYSRAELVGANVKILMPPSIAARHDEYLERCVREHAGVAPAVRA